MIFKIVTNGEKYRIKRRDFFFWVYEGERNFDMDMGGSYFTEYSFDTLDEIYKYIHRHYGDKVKIFKKKWRRI